MHRALVVPCLWFAVVVAVPVAVVVRAADAPAAKAPAARKIPRHDGPEIRWARSWRDARDEAAERGLPILLHSHGST